MPRQIEITVPSERTDHLLDELCDLPFSKSVRVQRGVSVQPPGDVIILETATRSLMDVMEVLDRHRIGQDEGTSITTSRPLSMISSSLRDQLVTDAGRQSWEEIELLVVKESHMTLGALLVMAAAGVFAAVGLATSALHLVIAGMVIAPGFEPILHIGLGVAAGSQAWLRGLKDFVKAYGVLFLSGLLTGFFLQALGVGLFGGRASYLPAGTLVRYWTTFSTAGILVSAVAAFGGALLVATNRSILTLGVMIALTLIPTMVIAGMGILVGDWGIVGRALLRWLVDVVLVVVISYLFFAWQRATLHRRRMML